MEQALSEGMEDAAWEKRQEVASKRTAGLAKKRFEGVLEGFPERKAYPRSSSRRTSL